MKEFNIYEGITAKLNEADGYAEISISDGITKIPTDIDDESYCYDDDRLYTSCIGDFIVQNNIKNIKIIGGGDLKDISNLFTFCNLQNVDLTSFDTSSVTNMFAMFYCCKVKQINFAGLFNTFNVVNMESMFENCNIEKLDLSRFNTSNVRSMELIFADCEHLETLDLSAFNTSNVTHMTGMFENCINLKNVDLSTFSADNLFDARSMFKNCTNLESIDIPNFGISKVRSLDCMFEECTNLKSIKLPNLKSIDKHISTNYMFENCTNLENIDFPKFEPTSSRSAYGMIYGCNNLKTVNVSKTMERMM